MLRFYSIYFFNFMEGLTTIELHSEVYFPPNEPIDQNRQRSWQQLLIRMREQSEQIGLRTVPAHLKILEASAAGGPITNGTIKVECATIKKIVQAELSHHLLFVIPQRDADFFGDFPLGHEVFDRFPSARQDIAEAAKALALDRSTASVLHLMRVLEVGLNALAHSLRIPYKHTNWEIVINQIPGRIKEIESKQRKPKDWRNLRQFLAEAGSDFRLLKDAFRNWAMHVHVAYDDRAAREIFDGTKAFMRHLATKLKE